MKACTAALLLLLPSFFHLDIMVSGLFVASCCTPFKAHNSAHPCSRLQIGGFSACVNSAELLQERTICRAGLFPMDGSFSGMLCYTLVFLVRGILGNTIKWSMFV